MSFSGPEESIFWSMRGVAAVAAFLALALLPQCERSDRSESRTGRDQEPAAVSVVGFVRPDPKGTSIEELARMFDPALDTFDTEVLHVAVKERLKTLTKLVEDLEQIDIQHVADVVTDSFACPPLRPNELVTVFDDALIIVREPQPTADAGPSNSHSGAEGLVAALQELVEALGEGRDIRAKTKVFKIEKSEGFFSTQIFFEASNREAKVGRQVNATWSCSWEYPADEGSAKPRLKSSDIEKYEETAR
jgi:hypothetical protein